MPARSARRTWRMPLCIGLASAAGLMGALVGDGLWDGLSCLALAWPLWEIAWRIVRAGRAPRRG